MVSILALHGPSNRFVFVEKAKDKVRLLDYGIFTDDKSALLKKASKIILEITGVRFLQDEAFREKSEADISESLTGYVKSGPDFILKKVSPCFAATVRPSSLNEQMDENKKKGIYPVLVLPENLGLYLYLKNSKKEGFFSIFDNGDNNIFFIQEGELRYFSARKDTDMDAAMKRFHLKDPSIPISPEEFLPEGLDASYASLYCLCAFSECEKETLNFASPDTVEIGLEKIKLKSSFIKCGLFSLPILLLLFYSMISTHMSEKAFQKIEVSYKTSEKRAKKALETRNEATSLFKDLAKISGASSKNLVSQALSEIGGLCPENVTLTSLSQDERLKATGTMTFMVSGHTEDMTSVFQFEAALKQGAFKETKVLDTRKSNLNNRETAFFRMEIK